MSAVRYLCVAILDGRRRVFLWESGDDAPDRVVLDSEGLVPTYDSELAATDAAPADERAVPNAWNLFTDLPKSDSLFAAANARANDDYNKLFWGCNLSLRNPRRQALRPRVEKVEISTTSEVLNGSTPGASASSLRSGLRSRRRFRFEALGRLRRDLPSKA